MTHNGLAQMKQAVRNVDLTTTHNSPRRNIGHVEQDVSLVGGAALLGLGLAKMKGPMGWMMLVAGGALVYRGLTGQCALYRKLGINTNK